MEHFVTLFDSLFLPQGLALHASMERHIGSYTLWILCMDDAAYEVLTQLQLPHVKRLRLSDVETPELLAVKPGRTRAEYCWTLAPFSPRFVFEADPSVNRATYIDADLWFRKNPKPVFREFDTSGKAVLLTDHAYAAEYDQSAVSGQYCVQFMTFVRDQGETVRKWWEERCIEWCFAEPDKGRFGDQKYLDDWPQRFESMVHVLADKELILAPWNASRFPFGNGVAWHFHGLRVVAHAGPSYSTLNDSQMQSVAIDPDQSIYAEFGDYVLPRCTRDHVYLPYVDDLRGSARQLAKLGVSVKTQRAPRHLSLIDLIKARLRIRARRFLGLA